MLCVEYVKRPKSSCSSLWVNGSYVTNFDSTASSGSADARARARDGETGSIWFIYGATHFFLLKYHIIYNVESDV